MIIFLICSILPDKLVQYTHTISTSIQLYFAVLQHNSPILTSSTLYWRLSVSHQLDVFPGHGEHLLQRFAKYMRCNGSHSIDTSVVEGKKEGLCVANSLHCYIMRECLSCHQYKRRSHAYVCVYVHTNVTICTHQCMFPSPWHYPTNTLQCKYTHAETTKIPQVGICKY